MNFADNYTSAKSVSNRKETKVFDYLNLFTITCLTITVLCFSTFFILCPALPNLFGCIISSSFVWTTLSSIIHCYYLFIYHMQLYVIILLAEVYGILFLPLICQEVRLGRKSYNLASCLRQPENLIRIYRALQLYHNMVSNWIGVFLFPLHALCALIFILGSFILIKMRANMTYLQVTIFISFTIGSLILWSLILVIYGNVNHNGIKILKSWKAFCWKSKYDKLLMQKFRVSCQPITVSWHKTFIIRRATLLIYLKGVSRGLFRILLANKI